MVCLASGVRLHCYRNQLLSFDAEATDRLDTREEILAPRVCHAHYVCMSSGAGEQRLEAEVFVVVDEDIDTKFHEGLRF